jgi:subfamily B ATP-binding cassette protein MsbA
VKGVWTAGSFIAFIAYAVMTYRPLKNFAELNAQLQLGLASSERIFEMIDKEPSIIETVGAKQLSPFSKAITYNNISFQYTGQNRLALDGVQLTVKAGEIVALVGSSGAGKSTMALLLPRFYDPVGGSLLIDGQDIRQVTLESLRKQIGLVTQEVLLFNESVRYNIAYGRPEASREEVEAAAERMWAAGYFAKYADGRYCVS